VGRLGYQRRPAQPRKNLPECSLTVCGKCVKRFFAVVHPLLSATAESICCIAAWCVPTELHPLSCVPLEVKSAQDANFTSGPGFDRR
jgi:hypothetical protein